MENPGDVVVETMPIVPRSEGEKRLRLLARMESPGLFPQDEQLQRSVGMNNTADHCMQRLTGWLDTILSHGLIEFMFELFSVFDLSSPHTQ